MSNYKWYYWLGFLSCYFIFLTLALLVKDNLVNKKEAIDAGAAYYHPQTDEFTWSSNLKKGTK